jgi:hypothetical protein
MEDLVSYSPPEPASTSTLERSTTPQAPATGRGPTNDGLRVITAGSVGNMEARLGSSGFDVVAVAETEDALIDAVSADDPDAIVVEADLCPSLEHVRDLAPDAVLLAVGDHTPPGALGRIERGVTGTVMAGLLHALVADGVAAAAAWGLVPAFRSGAALDGPQGLGGSLLFARADAVRAHLANALRDHWEFVAAVGTVAVTVSASLLLTLGPPRTPVRPEHVPLPAPALGRAQQHPVTAWSTTTRPSAHDPSRNESKPGEPRVTHRPETKRHRHGRHDDPSSHASKPPGVAYGWSFRPPKHADNGQHTGWDSNSVPQDLPPGSTNEHGRRPPSTGPPCLPAQPPCTKQ